MPVHSDSSVDARWNRGLQRHDAGQDRNPSGNASANAASPDKLLERMLGGVGEPASFGIVRDERRAAKSATLKLERNLARRLRERAAALDVSMESLICLAWSLVLVRFCGHDSVTFGAALPPLTKAFPVRIDATTRPADTAARELHELLAEIRSSLPGWAALPPKGDPGAASLRALFGYNLPEDHVWAQELSSGVWPVAVIVAEREETLLISAWAQNPADPATMCAYMRTALERLVGIFEVAPDSPAASIDVMPEEERHKLLIEWNATGAAYPRNTCVHELFEEHAARTPDAVAVVHDGRTLTYSQLNLRANQLAHHLRDLGVGPEVLVAICIERSPEMVVGLLAVLKAGGAYVPLDPAYPAERLRFMLEDSAPMAVLAHGALGERLAAWLPAGGPTVWAWRTTIRARPPSPHTTPISPRAAWPRVTSPMSSTPPARPARPKGVMVEHRGLINLASGATPVVRRLGRQPGGPVRLLQLRCQRLGGGHGARLGCRIASAHRSGASCGPLRSIWR